jgi:hypothetical protein
MLTLFDIYYKKLYLYQGPIAYFRKGQIVYTK